MDQIPQKQPKEKFNSSSKTSFFNPIQDSNWKKLFILASIANILDIALTYYFIGHLGIAEEANPIMASLISLGWEWAFLAKAAVGIIIYWFPDILLLIAFILYGSAVIGWLLIAGCHLEFLC